MSHLQPRIPDRIAEMASALEADELVDGIELRILNSIGEEPLFGDVIALLKGDDLVVSWGGAADETRVLFDDLVFEGVPSSEVPLLVRKLIRNEVGIENRGWLFHWKRATVSTEHSCHQSDWTRVRRG